MHHNKVSRLILFYRWLHFLTTVPVWETTTSKLLAIGVAWANSFFQIKFRISIFNKLSGGKKIPQTKTKLEGIKYSKNKIKIHGRLEIVILPQDAVQLFPTNLAIPRTVWPDFVIICVPKVAQKVATAVFNKSDVFKMG